MQETKKVLEKVQTDAKAKHDELQGMLFPHISHNICLGNGTYHIGIDDNPHLLTSCVLGDRHCYSRDRVAQAPGHGTCDCLRF